MMKFAATSAVWAVALFAAPLAGCATGKSEVPDPVKRYTGEDCGCNTGGFGATTLVHGANKTVAGATRGAIVSTAQGVSSFDSPVANVLYAPFGVVGGLFTGVVDGVGSVPAVQNCHYDFGRSLEYGWRRDARVGAEGGQVPQHGYRDANGNPVWNGGSYWPGGAR
jgi:hypothetical protein